MRAYKLTTLALAAGIGLSVPASASEILRGSQVAFGDGTVQSWVRLDGQDRPRQIGVSISDEAFGGLGQEGAAVTVPLPEAARTAGYDHVSLDWAPHGHPPAEFFAAPHFDVHFYLTSEARRLAIDPSDPDYLEKAAREPSRDLMPADYMPPPEPEPVPAMGVHWIDVTDPVLSDAAPFENIFIYGAWDGGVTFLEPMVTLDLLASKKTVVTPVKQPSAVSEAGYYPTRYRVEFDRTTGTHDIVLDGLKWRAPTRTSAALDR